MNTVGWWWGDEIYSSCQCKQIGRLMAQVLVYLEQHEEIIQGLPSPSESSPPLGHVADTVSICGILQTHSAHYRKCVRMSLAPVLTHRTLYALKNLLEAEREVEYVSEEDADV